MAQRSESICLRRLFCERVEVNCSWCCGKVLLVSVIAICFCSCVFPLVCRIVLCRLFLFVREGERGGSRWFRLFWFGTLTVERYREAASCAILQVLSDGSLLLSSCSRVSQHLDTIRFGRKVQRSMASCAILQVLSDGSLLLSSCSRVSQHCSWIRYPELRLG